MSPESFYERFIESDLMSFVGLKFEKLCEQYLINKSYNNELDFTPLRYGKFYGKHQNGETFDIDVFFADEKTAICGECKFTNHIFDMSDMNELVKNSTIEWCISPNWLL